MGPVKLRFCIAIKYILLETFSVSEVGLCNYRDKSEKIG